MVIDHSPALPFPRIPCRPEKVVIPLEHVSAGPLRRYLLMEAFRGGFRAGVLGDTAQVPRRGLDDWPAHAARRAGTADELALLGIPRLLP